VILFGLFYAYYLQTKNDRLEYLVRTSELVMQDQNLHFGELLRDSANDLILLDLHISLETADINRGDEIPPGMIRSIGYDLAEFMKVTRNVDQIRLLNLNGKEIVRINMVKGQAVTVPEDQLQDKSKRYYYQAMKKLGKNQLYASDLDLNIENGEIELPYKPTIRLGTVIYGGADQPLAYLVTNYLARPMLDHFRFRISRLNAEAFLVNSEGRIISAPDSSPEWDTTYSELTGGGSGEKSLWQTLAAAGHGMVSRDGSTYLHANTNPYDELSQLHSLDKAVIDPGYYWKTVIRIGEEHLQAEMAPYVRILWQSYILVLLLLILVSLLAGVYLDRRRTYRNKSNLMMQSFESAGEAIIVTDSDGRIEYVNPSFTEMSGYSLEDVTGRRPSILKNDEGDIAFHESLWTTISSGRKWQGSRTDKRKDGTPYPVVISVAPIKDDNGNITNYIAIQQDMSKERELEQQLVHAQKMEAVGTLVGGISHDFNNILAAMQGNLFLAKRHIGSPADIEDRLDKVETLTEQAADMIRQLLTFARKDQVTIKPFQCNTFIREVFKLNQASIPENIDFSYRICEEELVVNGDSTQIQQALLNLLANARHAVADTPAPRIECTLEKYEADEGFASRHPEIESSSFARLSVSDNGYGIAPEAKDKIFEPFYTTKGVGHGTGLGLSMIYGAMLRHGGTIEVESEVGQGSIFHLYLPLASSEAEIEGTATGEIVNGSGETILLAEDAENIRKTTSEVLKRIGYKVIEAKNGKEAIRLFKRRNPEISLVILDMIMPKMGGFETAKQIRVINSGIPVIFITGYEASDIIEQAEKMDRTVILPKPFSLDGMSRAIRQLIDGE